MSISKMTVKQFRQLPPLVWGRGITFDSLIILPARFDRTGLLMFRIRSVLARLFGFQEPDVWQVEHLHDSGYRCMDFVACKDDEPICRLSGCSDVIHVDGIGGYGNEWLERYGTIPETIPPSGWSIDCLPASGLLRMWPASRKMTCGPALSSFEIFALPRREEVDEALQDNP